MIKISTPRSHLFALSAILITTSTSVIADTLNDAKHWAINTTLSYGNDDNVISFIDESETNPLTGETSNATTSEAGSQGFTEFSLTPMWFSSGDFKNNWIVDATVFSSQYDDADDYNLQVLALGARKNTALNTSNTLTLGIRADHSQVGEEDYLQSLYYEAFNRYKNRNGFSLKYGARLQQSQALDDQFEPFEGTTTRLYSELVQRVDKHRLSLRLQADDEKKGTRGDANFNEDVSYFSVNRIALRGSWTYLGESWRSRVSYEYRDSNFKDDYISFLADSATSGCGPLQQLQTICSVDSRSDTRNNLSISLSKDLNDNWYIEGEWRQIDNSSSIERFSYDNQVVTFTVGWQI